jgi:hypothetical protein
MFSWFPLYFPSQQPFHVPDNGVVKVDIWRKCSATKVWYEWMFTVLIKPPSRRNRASPENNMNNNNNSNNNMEMDHDPIVLQPSPPPPPPQQPEVEERRDMILHYVSPIHNPNGRSSYVSLLS